MLKREQIEEWRNRSLTYYRDWDYTGDNVMIPTRHGSIRSIFYRPKQPCSRLTPVFFNVHGGGFVVHKAEADQPFCEKLREQLGILVVSIDYTLAPEAPLPRQMEEVYDVILHVYQNAEQYSVDPMKMAIGGHSAGGHIATVVSIMANQRREFPLVCQVLDYPATDWTTPAKDKFVGAAEQMVSEINDFAACIATPENKQEYYLSPLLYATDEMLRGLPPTVMTICENDLLRREDEAYLNRLLANGVEVTARLFLETSHAFTADFYYTETAQQGHRFMIDGMRRYLR